MTLGLDRRCILDAMVLGHPLVSMWMHVSNEMLV